MFGFDLEKYKILVHPQSYVHAIIKFKNGLIKMLLHDTDMKIPIFNSIYDKKINYISSKKINSKTLFIKFADSIESFLPILQFGCLTAFSGVIVF